MKKLLFIGTFLSIFGSTPTWGQAREVAGEVSYVASENVYVRFVATSDLTAGDTLYLDGAPCLKVLQVSSVSAVTERMGACEPAVGDQVILRVLKTNDDDSPETTGAVSAVDTSETGSDDSLRSLIEVIDKSKRDWVDGRFSIASYSNYTPDDNEGGYTRMVGRAYVNADQIGGSRWSFNTYFNFQEYIRSDNNPSRGRQTLLNVYRAAITYQAKDSLAFTLGRAINTKVSSLGPMDGLQVEKYWGSFFAGAIVGSRPGLQDFSYDPSLFEYGAYAGVDRRQGDWRIQATAGFLEQRNQGKVDRRFLYFQESTSWKNWYWFASGEMDLYENFDTASAANTFKLTSLYTSLRYRINRHWTAFASFDSRDRIIFFEQFDTEIERLLADQKVRQGYRARLNYRSSSGWSLGAVFNYRKELQTYNFSQFVQLYGMYRLPVIGGNFSARYGQTTSRYLLTRLWSARYSRNWFNGKLYAGVYYRGLGYTNQQTDVEVPTQHYYGMEATGQIVGSWRLGGLAEYSKQGGKRVYRINATLQYRF
jgi:hypothetical protein